MKTEKEKKLEIQLLTEKIERITGKKVTLREKHEGNYLKNEKIVELNIVDMKKEDVVCSLKVLHSTAKQIEKALFKDNKEGGIYRAMYEEGKDYRYLK